jgi:hypothetical protein
MDEHEVETTGQPEPAGERPAGDATPAPGGSPAPHEAAPSAPAITVQRSTSGGGGLRLLAALVTLPWAVLYGVTGSWAVARAARAYADGLGQFDAGYTRFVTPAELMLMGALVLAGFAVTLACALLLLFQSRSVIAWLPLFLVAAGLTGGSVWAAVSGGLHPGLWVILFFGLAYATAIALLRVVQVTRAARGGRIERP